MPAFNAINVEPEDNVDEQVDNTRELQIDEALKRFQAALKLHAQGPDFLDEASDAYDELFRADIFKFPQAQTDYDRLEHGNLGAAAPLDQYDVPTSELENTATSLSQTLYLAYKNRGLLALDRIKHRASALSPAPTNGARHELYSDQRVVEHARQALADFDVALDHDPSDADLWRKAARVAASLNSTRIKRYCLEAAIELDDDPTVVEVEPPSLAEALAGEQLKEQLQVLGDEVALSHPAMRPWVKKRMPAMLRRHLDPIPFLPDPSKVLGSLKRIQDLEAAPVEIQIRTASWAEIGTALLEFMEQDGATAKRVRLRVLEDGGQAGQQEESGPYSDDEMDVADVHLVAKAASSGDELGDHEMANGLSNGTSGSNGSNGSNGTNETDDKQPNGQGKRLDAPNGERGEARRRKRSQSVAGIRDAAEETVAEKRSKRIRRRDTVEETVDPAALKAEQLASYQATDRNLSELTQRLLGKIGVDGDAAEMMSKLVAACGPENRSSSKLPTVAMADLRDCLVTFKEDVVKVLLKKEPAKDHAADQAKERLLSFIDHVNGGTQEVTPAAFDDVGGARRFVAAVNRDWATCVDVAYAWILAMSASWTQARWPEAARAAAKKLTMALNDVFYGLAQQGDCGPVRAGKASAAKVDRLVQMLFELHLDLYADVTQPASIASLDDREEVKGWLRRWQELASERAALRPAGAHDRLDVRFLWATVVGSTTLSHSHREHTLRCWAELRDYLVAHECGSETLPNSTMAPTISAAAADREISKLTTMDFFISLFQHDHVKDPLHVIDSLEPVLNPASVVIEEEDDDDEKDDKGQDDNDKNVSVSNCASQRLQDIWKFLESSTTELRLFLWTRLGEAYGQLEYRTKQFSCHLRCLEMLVAELDRAAYETTPAETRRALLFHILKHADESLTKALSLALNDATAYDIVDEQHLGAAAATLARLCPLLHVAMAYDDELRVGTAQPPSTHAAVLTALLTKLREMQIRAWCLQYSVVKMASQPRRAATSSPSSATVDVDLAELMSAVHQVLGQRRACNNSNKIFLHMMRVELLKCRAMDRWEDYVGQVLFDLYGLKLGAGACELQDHGCVPEKITRRTTMQLVGKVVAMARRLPMRDLLKSDLKTAIESLQLAIGQPKSNAQMLHNMRNFTEHLKKPIHPFRLIQALSRRLSIDSVDVRAPEAALARHGWFFLLGTIALARFKMADLKKRQTPGATDDLRLGATWLKLQLQFTPDKWEAWFRLGECFDYELEDAVLWTADKMNKDRGELVKLQRSAIHCYTLALSLSREGNQWRTEEGEEGEGETKAKSKDTTTIKTRTSTTNGKVKNGSTEETIDRDRNKNSGDDEDEDEEGDEDEDDTDDDTDDDTEDEATQEALYELHHAFAMRMYASSREPFAMEPFKHTEQRVIIMEDASTRTALLFDQMRDFTVWRYAATLFRRAAKQRPREWKNHYMLAKCLWKMSCADDATLTPGELARTPGHDEMLGPLERAVGLVTALPRSRHSEPILEPHYKMASMVNKLVLRGDMAAQQGADILARQPFGVGLDDSDSDSDSDDDDNGGGGGGNNINGAGDGEGGASSDDTDNTENAPAVTATTDKDAPKIVDLDDWEEYMVKSLRLLRDKDKAGWHHRIIMRHARIVFNENTATDSRLQAMGAFNVLRESMFTKTMVMNVWKCDAERPGRHHVYTERYARFMVRLLVATGDRQNLELLLKRLRKKGADFYMFADLWAHACLAYLQLLRDAYGIPVLPEDHFRGVYTAEFDAVGDRIGAFLADPSAHTPAYECMRDAIELKKLNSNLMRVGPIDDLITDCYGAIYFDVGRMLHEPPPSSSSSLSLSPPPPPPPAEDHAPWPPADGTFGTPPPSHLDPAQGVGFGLGIGLGLRPPHSGSTTTNANTPFLSSAVDTPPAPAPAVPVTAAAAAAATEAPKAAARRAGIRRPEVLRKAELVLNRSMEPPRSAGLSKARSNGGGGGGAIGGGAGIASRSVSSAAITTTPAAAAASTKRRSVSGTPRLLLHHILTNDDDDDTEMKDADTMVDIDDEDEDGAANVTVAPTGAPHDDEDDIASVASNNSAQHFADDESDLSDAPDDDEMEEESTLLFPNLRQHQQQQQEQHQGMIQQEHQGHQGHQGQPGPLPMGLFRMHEAVVGHGTDTEMEGEMEDLVEEEHEEEEEEEEQEGGGDEEGDEGGDEDEEEEEEDEATYLTPDEGR